MFSYYGTKRKLAGLYPDPIHDTIIEPFAGAAAYSLHGDRWKKEVILYDTNPKICAVWHYLIHATKKDILSLPDLKTGDKVTSFPLIEAEKYLIGFCINPGSSCPKITASARSKWPMYKKRIADEIHKVKHWAIYCKSYELILNQKATWHVDPPYQIAGKYYFGHNILNFDNLSK